MDPDLRDYVETLPWPAAAIVAEALRVASVQGNDDWIAKRIGASAATDRLAFAELLPSPALWREALRVPYSCKAGVTRGVSTCGLIAVGILCRAGFALGWDAQPYGAWTSPVTGKAHRFDVVSQLSQLVHDAKARRVGYPRAGDVCCIGTGLATHVLTVVTVDGHTVWSVDGGQVDAARGYLQCVKLLRRDWRGLRVQWVLDTGRLARAICGP